MSKIKIKKNSVARGMEAELLVQIELLKRNYVISIPTSHQSQYDLIADNGILHRIQIKRAYIYSHNGKLKLVSNISRTMSRYSNQKLTNSYSDKAFDFYVFVDCSNKDYWIVPKSATKKQNTVIYLETVFREFKNKWDILD